MDSLAPAVIPVVGLGASAGGIEAFRGFFEHMHPDSGLAFVVVLHLPVDRKSILPELLERWTSMSVIQATEGCAIMPDCIYVPPPGIGIVLRQGCLYLHMPAPDEPREPMPISLFFNSLARELGSQAVGVVLSGTGNDGALGLKAIKTCGGLTLAQGADGSGPQHGGMPASAIATGAVDIVAPVESLPGHILAVRRALQNQTTPADLPSVATRHARLAICTELHRQSGHDFSLYKEKTFLRRVQRRMQVLGVDTLDDYHARLKADRNEGVMLLSDLLISVTGFFRDSETFTALENIVIPGLFAGKGADAAVRVWVAGCATGEEAYSLAILLREFSVRLGLAGPRVQVFATDIDEPAIAGARAGRYPSALVQGLSPERLARFFNPGNDGSYTVAREVREICTFSAHSLTRDPPFSRLDLVSCRNLLIYLDTELQTTVIPAFHYALVPGGILLLGSSETISRHEGLFTTVDRRHRIFRRNDTPNPGLHLAGRPAPADPAGSTALPTQNAAGRGRPRPPTRASARVLERFGPAFVVVTAAFDIVEYSSRTGPFLEPAAGVPSRSLLDLARPGLRAPLRAALKQVAESGHPAEKSVIPVDLPGSAPRRITIAVERLADATAHPVFLVVFLEAERDPGAAEAERREAPDIIEHDGQLEAELRDVREQLQSVAEEHDTALEELKSTNEELHSVNEELQSANEELETSKEEIQSINEELQTVNTQLAAKVDELDHKNSDLQNLFASTQVATVFLDQYLVIRGFTPAVAEIYNLIPTDMGRPLSDIVSRLRYADLRQDIRQVLATLEPLERRVVRDDDTTHYLMRIMPYRTPDSTVDGAVLTFVEVTSIVQAEQHQRLLVDELNHRVKNMLTVVISLATQTMRGAKSMDEFAENYLGRIHALTAAYSLLSSEAWQAVKLRDVLMQELAPFLHHDGANIVVDGPEILLQPRAALALGLAIHELTTNAVKFGALSTPKGTVSVIWQLETRENDDEVTLVWTERGGPPVTPPQRRGFGTMLIERGLSQDMFAEVTIAFEPQGVSARLRAPLLRSGAG